MRMKTGDLKRLGKTGTYLTTTGYTMTLHQNGVIGAFADCDYTELEEKKPLISGRQNVSCSLGK